MSNAWGVADAHTMARFDRPPLSTVRARPHRGAAAAAPGGLLRRGGVRACAILRGCATIATAPALPTHCYRLALACARVSSVRARGACDAGERHQTLWLPVLPPAHRLERAAQHPQLLHVTLVRRPVVSLGVFWQSVCVCRRHPLCSQPQARRPRVCRLRTVFR